jgi:hypothetical protein
MINGMQVRVTSVHLPFVSGEPTTMNGKNHLGLVAILCQVIGVWFGGYIVTKAIAQGKIAGTTVLIFEPEVCVNRQHEGIQPLNGFGGLFPTLR